jgi:hypothetical protein
MPCRLWECDEMGTSGWWQNFHESQKLSFSDRKPGLAVHLHALMPRMSAASVLRTQII